MNTNVPFANATKTNIPKKDNESNNKQKPTTTTTTTKIILAIKIRCFRVKRHLPFCSLNVLSICFFIFLMLTVSESNKPSTMYGLCFFFSLILNHNITSQADSHWKRIFFFFCFIRYYCVFISRLPNQMDGNNFILFFCNEFKKK